MNTTDPQKLQQDQQKLALRAQGVQPYTTAAGQVVADPMHARRQAEQQQAEAERLVEQRQKDEQKAAAQAQKDAFTAEQTQREHEYRAQGASTYTTADGVIHKDPLFEQKQQEKAAKEAADLEAKQARAEAIRSGRRHQVNPVDGKPIYLESEQALEQRQKDEADKIRRATLDDKIKAAEAEYGMQTAQQEAAGFKPLTDAGRKNLETKGLAKARQEGIFALQAHYQQAAKEVSGGNDWIPFNESATEGAKAAQQHLARLSDPNADLTEEDLATLEANDATKPIAARIRQIQDRLKKDDELKKFHGKHATRLAELKLRRDAPEQWAEMVRARRQQMSPEELQTELAGSNEDLNTRAQAIQQKAAELNGAAARHQLELDSLAAEAARRRQQGIPAGESVSYKNADGTVEHWPRDLAARREDIVARLQDTQAQQTGDWAALQNQQEEWNRDAALHQEAADSLKAQAQKQRQDFIQTLKDSPATAGAGQALDALDAEHQTRLADMESAGTATPEALAAAEKDYQTRAQAILDTARQAEEEKQSVARAASVAYRRDGFDADIGQALTKSGLDPTNPEHVAAWWDARKQDFAPVNILDSAPLPKAGPEDIEFTALLSDGSLAVHPQFTFDAKRYAEAVEKSAADPEAKAAAMADLPRKQLAQAASMLPMLKEVQDIPGIPSFAKWVKSTGAKGSEAQQAKDYLEAMQARGWWQKIPDTVARNLLAGLSDIGTQTVGTLGLLTGSQTLSEAAASWSADASRLTNPLEAEGANSSLPAAILGQTSRMAGPMAAMLLVTRGLGGSIGIASTIAASQTAGSQYAETYNSLREQGLSHDEAWKQTAPYALASGLVTAALTAAGGKTGVEAALKSKAGQQAAQSFWRHALTNIPKQAGAEIAEELPDELFSQISQAMAEGKKSPQEIAQVIGQFWESSPALIGSIALMGAGGGVVESYKATANAAQPAEAVHPANLPETVAAAESAIDSFTDPNLDEATIARTQDAARGVLYIAQGTPLTDLDSDTLASLDIVEDPKKPGSFINGRIVPNAKTGIPEVQPYPAGMAPVTNPDGTAGQPRPVRVKIVNGQPVISQSTLDNLETKLPAVRAAIPLDEKSRLDTVRNPQPGKPAQRQAPAAGSGPDANQGAVQNPARQGTQPAPGGNTAPRARTAVEQEFDAALKDSQEEQARYGTAEFNIERNARALDRLDKARKALEKEQARNEAIDTSREDLKQNHAQGPALADLIPAESSLDEPGVQRATELATVLESRGLDPEAARKAAVAVVTEQGIVGDSAEEQYAQGIDEVMARLGWIRGTGKNYTFIDRNDAADPFAPAPAKPAPKQTSSTAASSLTDRMVVAKQKAMKKVPVAQRPRFQKFYSAIDRQLALLAPAFPGGIEFTTTEGKKGLEYTGAGIAVVQASTNPKLVINLAELFGSAEHLDTKQLPAFVRRALMHELRHIAALKVITPEQAESLWRSLTPALKQRVYASYFAADLHNAAGGKPLTQRELLAMAAAAVGKNATLEINGKKLPKPDPFQMAHEFLRMLDEDAEFAGQTSEAMDASPGLGKAILDFLAKVIDDIKKLIATELDPATRIQVREFQKLVEGARKQILAGLAAPDKTYKGAPPANLAAVTDNRAGVTDKTDKTPPRSDFQPVLGATGTAYTDSNDPIEYQWAVVDVNSLNVSNRDNGTINPDYPQELQPRDRTSAASEAQVNDIAKNFNLDRLSASSSVGDGAPIIGQDGVVESGNGRIMGARRSHATGKDSANSYRDALIRRAAEFGLNAEQVEAVPNPVLVRVRTTDVNRTAFVLAANVSTIAPKREMEQAKIDSKQIVPDLFDSFVPSEDGEIFTAANADFIRGFISQVIPPAERGQVIDASGNLSQSGLRRIRNALFVHAYGTSPEALNALGRLTESIDATDVGIARALLAMAPRFAEQNARIANGALYPFSITENLAQALQKLSDLRNRGQSIENWLQEDRIPGIGDDPGPVTTALVKFLHENRQKPRQLLNALDRYAKALDGAGDPRQISIFGEEKPTPLDLWNIAANYKAPALAMGSKRVDTTAEKVDFNRDMLAAKIDQDRFIGPNWYYSTLKKLRKALARGEPVSIENREVSDYGGTLSVIINGEEMPLTRRKVPHRDMHFHFGVQKREKLPPTPTPEPRSPTPGFAVVMPNGYNIVGYAPRSNNRFENQPVYSNGTTRLTEEEALGRGIAKERIPYGPATNTGTANAYVELPPKKALDRDWQNPREAVLDALGHIENRYIHQIALAAPDLAAATSAVARQLANSGSYSPTGKHWQGTPKGLEVEYLGTRTVIPWKAVAAIARETSIDGQDISPSPSLPFSESLPSKTAFKLYRTLTEKQKAAPLTPPQSKALEKAERSLGQLFLFDSPNPTLKPAEDLVLEQQTASRATFADSRPQQMKLFMATKRALYSKARKQKELLPIIAMLARLRKVIPDALVQAVAETVVPKIPPRIRALMDRAAADYDAWLQPRMDALRPQWQQFRARFTEQIRNAFDTKLEDIAREHDGMPMTRVPLKGDRGMEKAILDAKEDSDRTGTTVSPDVTKINDVLRASLIANDDEGVMRLVNAVRTRFKVVKEKDRFTKPIGGYHDWLFVVEVAPGLRAEVQVHRVDYIFSKQVGPGHLMYEDYRRLEQLVKVNSDPAIHAYFRRLGKAMEGYYTRIGQAFTIARKEASSITTPSLNTREESIGNIPAGPATIGSGGSPSLSQATGFPSTSKNSVVGGNESGTLTPQSTTETLDKQGVRITPANILQYAGNVDVTALQGRQKDWKQAFEFPAGARMIPLARLVSPKNELEDPKFKAGQKKDPRQNAADWILKAMEGDPAAKKRAPLDVSPNGDGTFTIHDGNATAQALMLAGWKAVPANVTTPEPAAGTGDFLAKGRTRALDAEYMAAVNTGDVTRQQAMVDEAAHRAGYKRLMYHGTTAADRDHAAEQQRLKNAGRSAAWQTTGPGHYEGTRPGDWDVFKMRDYSPDGLFFFSPERGFADQFRGDWDGKKPGRMIRAWIKADNTFDYHNPDHLAQIADLIDGPVNHAMGWMKLEKPEVIARIRELGFDSIIVPERRDLDTPNMWDTIDNLAVFSAEQIKAADPVTYDKDGNVIPLSQRFNAASPSILYHGTKTVEEPGNTKAGQKGRTALAPEYRAAWEDFTAEGSSSFDLFPKAWELYKQQIEKEPEAVVQKRILDAYLQAMKDYGAILDTRPVAGNFGYLWEDEKPFLEAIRGTAMGEPASGTGNFLAKGRTALDDGPDLFSFNTGLNLDELLTPGQKQAKLDQSQTLDLFGGTPHAQPRPASQRPARPVTPSRRPAPAQQSEGFGELFAQPGMAGGPGPNSGTTGTAGLGGGPGTRGNDAAGGDVAGKPDSVPAQQSGDSSGSGMSGRPGSRSNLDSAPSLVERPEPGSPARNFSPPADLSRLAPAGAKAKIRANLDAIALLKKLEAEGRDATPEEKRTLAAYSGWGAFKEAFNDSYEGNRDYYVRNPHVAQYNAYARSVLSWHERWGDLHDTLKKELTEDEYRAASRSTLNAHYTAAPVIRAMWSMMARLGFKGGRALEPSAGNGHYLGLMPPALADRTRWQAVELDELTARLLAKLYPEATVNEHLGGQPGRTIDGLGFERARIPNGSLDLIISNVPFHESGPRKKGFPNLNLHNFFFAHALDKVKPGGLVAFITSSSTMQNNQKQRDFIASKGDLVAAFRLPNNAFKENAGTEVVTDILILRKPDGTPFQGKPWRNLVEVGRQKITLTQGKDQKLDELRREARANGDVIEEYTNDNGIKAIDVNAPILVNEYFAEHPEHVLGSHSLQGSMYRGNEYTVTAPAEMDVGARLEELAGTLPENVMGTQQQEAADRALAGYDDRPFSFKEQDGKVYEVQDDGTMIDAEWWKNPANEDQWEAFDPAKAAEVDRQQLAKWEADKEEARKAGKKTPAAPRPQIHAVNERIKTFRSWLRVKNAIRALIMAESNPNTPDSALVPLRRELNIAYDTHVAAHGYITRRFGNKHTHLYSDPEFPLTAALENEKVKTDPQTGKREFTYSKASILSKRVMKPITEPKTASDIQDAVEKSLAWRGTLAPAWMAELMDTTVEDINSRLDAIPGVFEDPGTSTYQTAETYLTGNIRTKLDAAEEAARDNPKFEKNVEALRAVMPERRTIAAADPSLGERWIPSAVYDAFVKEVLGGSDRVEYVAAGNSFLVQGTHLYRNADFDTDRLSAYELFDHALSLKEPMIYDRTKDGSVFNATATAAAKAALTKMRRAFNEFVKTSEVPVEVENADGEKVTLPVWQAAENTYNETMNNFVTPKQTGEYLQFPGLTDHVYRTAHRRAVIARFLTERRGMMAHGVGSGKTFNQIVLAQEMRRLGLAKKPLIVVQNSTLGQFAASYMQAYPGARILVPSERDLQTQNRRKLVSKIATGDYDAVILSHSQFDLITNKPESVKAYMGEKIDELKELILRAKKGDKSKVRDLEGMLKRLEDRLASMLASLKARQDSTIYFEDLGVDALIVDEAHNYKSIPIVTRMGRVKGIPSGADSQRAIGMLLKARHVQSKTGGRNVFLATGTPVKNSMAEAYIMMDLMAPDILAEYHIHNFDDFATAYGEVVSSTEISWTGAPKVEARFAKFKKGRELITMIRSAFDVAMGNDKLGLKVPKVKGGAPSLDIVPATPTIDRFNAWVRSVADRWASASGKEKEEFTAVPIMTLQAGIVAALDPRLLAPGAPDHEGSKVNTAVRDILRLYHEGTPKKTTQLVFADLRNPFNMEYLSNFAGHPFPEYADGAGDFDLYEDIKKKLIAGGVPAKEILLMDPSMSKAKRTAAFEKVSSGEIRIAIGSTETLGVGVNVQERLKGLHHLMPPRDFTPAMHEQRNGRAIRQGNLHYDWNEEIVVRQWGTEGSMDSAVYGTLGRKQRFITQLLMGEIGSDTFDDPTDPIAVNLAEMAARTMGDPDFIRRIEVEKELRDLRLENDAFYAELSARRSRLSGAEWYADFYTKQVPLTREKLSRLASLWTRTAPRPEGVQETTDITDKPVYEFGDRVIDTAAKEGGIVTPLDVWLLDESKNMERQGKKQSTGLPLTVNGHAFTVQVETTMPGSTTPGSLHFEGEKISSFNGAEGLIRTLRRIIPDLESSIASYQSNIKHNTELAGKLRDVIARESEFPRKADLQKLEDELAAVDARLAAKAAPPAPAGGQASTSVNALPPLKPVNPNLLTADVRDVLENSWRIGSKVFLPDNLDRKLYERVNKALESVGGKWNRKAQAHLFSADPSKFLGIEIEDRTHTLAKATTVALLGPVADSAARAVLTSGNYQFTDGATGNGPYLPQDVEDAIQNELPDGVDAWTASVASLDSRDRESVVFRVTPHLAKATVAARREVSDTPDTPASYDTAPPDPYTGIPSLITGSRLSREQGRAIGHAHARRLRAGMSSSRDSGHASPALAASRAGTLNVGQTSAPAPAVPVLSTSQFSRLQKLPLIGEGAEAKVYADRQQGVVYKVLQGYAPVPGVIGSTALGVWPQVYYTSQGRLDYAFAPAERPRQLAVRLAVQTLVGGTPTEIVGIGPEGHIILKQPLSPAPEIGRDENFIDNSGLSIARHRAGLVEIPKAMLADPASPRVFLAMVEGRPWLLMDLHPDNFVGDNQAQGRINDAIVGQLPGSLIAKVPGLAQLVRDAAARAKTLGDRSDRLFKATTAATPATASPLAKLGWNHLDRAASAKIAAHTRWLRDPAKRIAARASENIAANLVAMWTGQKDAKPFLDAAHALKREFFPDSVLPREILAKKREMEIKTAMGSQRAMDLVRALSGNPKFSDIAYPPGFAENPMHRRHLYEAMAGERPLTSLPPELQALARKLRAILVEIGQEAVKQGRMSTDTFDNLRGTYMPHFYKEDVQREKSLFQKFRLGVRDILAQRTTAWHITDTSQKDANGEHRLVSHTGNQWRFRSPEHMNAFFEDFINQQALDELRSRYGKKFKALTAADLLTPSKLDPEIRGRLQEIKRGLTARYQRHAPLTIAEQEKAGLIMDPVYAIARYAAQMAHDNNTAAFFNAIAADKSLVSDIATPGFTEIPDNPRFGRLAGRHVQNDIAGQVLEMIEAPNIALKIYDTTLGWWKTGKTVLNPGTHVRNVLGNLFFSQLAGNSVWNPGNAIYYRQAVAALRNGGATLTEAYDQGVLGADFVSAELRQTLRQLLPDPATIVDDGKAGGLIMGIGKAIGRYLGTPAHKVYDVATALYQAEDEVFKLATYLKAKAMGQSATEAAAHVRQWYPYFDSGTSGTLKLIGRTAMPFLGFYRESIRIFGHALKERPLALATGLAVPSLITLFSALAMGLDDDDLDEVKKDMRGKAGKLLGPTPLEGMPLFAMLLPVRSDTGALQQFDISAVHPFVDFLGNRVESGDTEDWWQKTLRSLISAGPIGSLLYAQTTGRDAFGDRPFVEDNMSGFEKLVARADNAAKIALPPLLPGGTGFKTLLNAGERSTNKTFETRSPAQAVLRAVGGLDVRNATPDLYRLADDWRKANGYEVQEGMDYGSTTPASRARKALFAQLAQDEPNLTAVRNLLTSLDKLGHPVRTDQDINKLLFYRDPLKLIGGNKARDIPPDVAQAQFRASLTGEARSALENALQEFQRIKARAPAIIRQAR